MELNPYILAYVTDAVKQASVQPEMVTKQAAEQAMANNAYWEEMYKQASVAEDQGREQAFNAIFSDEFTKVASQFAAEHGYLPESILALYQG